MEAFKRDHGRGGEDGREDGGILSLRAGSDKPEYYQVKAAAKLFAQDEGRVPFAERKASLLAVHAVGTGKTITGILSAAMVHRRVYEEQSVESNPQNSGSATPRTRARCPGHRREPRRFGTACTGTLTVARFAHQAEQAEQADPGGGVSAKKTVIIAPKSVVPFWEEKIKEWTVLDGPKVLVVNRRQDVETKPGCEQCARPPHASPPSLPPLPAPLHSRAQPPTHPFLRPHLRCARFGTFCRRLRLSVSGMHKLEAAEIIITTPDVLEAALQQNCHIPKGKKGGKAPLLERLERSVSVGPGWTELAKSGYRHAPHNLFRLLAHTVADPSAPSRKKEVPSRVALTIVDEVHQNATPSSWKGAGIRRFTEGSIDKLGLTGTPVTHHPSDLADLAYVLDVQQHDVDKAYRTQMQRKDFFEQGANSSLELHISPPPPPPAHIRTPANPSRALWPSATLGWKQAPTSSTWARWRSSSATLWTASRSST